MEKLQTFIDTTFITYFPQQLHEQIHYLLNDGKKLRPSICLAFTNQLQTDNDDIITLTLCCIIELIHCISLVIDDLPDIDNDLERRNKPAFHVKYGESNTTFFIYYILNKLHTVINDLLHNKLGDNLEQVQDMYNITLCTNMLYLFKLNLDNLIDGQYIDLSQNTPLLKTNLDLYNMVTDLIFNLITECNISLDINTENTLYKLIMLNIKKTGTLFSLSTCVGLLLNLWYGKISYTGKETIHDDTPIDSSTSNYVKTITFDGNTDNIFNIIATWGYILGIIYQISDDILDYEIDKLKNKPNFCNILEKENIIKIFHYGCNWLLESIKTIDINIKRLWNINLDCEKIIKIIKNIESRV